MTVFCSIFVMGDNGAYVKSLAVCSDFISQESAGCSDARANPLKYRQKSISFTLPAFSSNLRFLRHNAEMSKEVSSLRIAWQTHSLCWGFPLRVRASPRAVKSMKPIAASGSMRMRFCRARSGRCRRYCRNTNRCGLCTLTLHKFRELRGQAV